MISNMNGKDVFIEKSQTPKINEYISRSKEMFSWNTENNGYFKHLCASPSLHGMKYKVGKVALVAPKVCLAEYMSNGRGRKHCLCSRVSE